MEQMRQLYGLEHNPHEATCEDLIKRAVAAVKHPVAQVVHGSLTCPPTHVRMAALSRHRVRAKQCCHSAGLLACVLVMLKTVWARLRRSMLAPLRASQ